ncbi:MAG: tripartite tricarboxylate transporter permease [Trueperaceae bacterium]
MPDLVLALSLVFTVENLIAVMIGVTLGIVLGSIPGLTADMAIALLVPFTFFFNPLTGIVALMAVAKGGSFGGSIPAILFNMPGTPQATATALDGFPMRKKGEGKKALEIAHYASTTGDLISDFILLLVAAPLAAIALKIGPIEYSAIILFSLVVIATATGAFPVRGMIGIGIGLLLGTVGRDDFLATERFTFGLLTLEDGINLVPLLLGLLVLSEAFSQLRYREPPPPPRDDATLAGDTSHVSWRDYRRLFPTMLRSGLLGTGIGALPGIGATVGAFLSYETARRMSKQPEKFGTGIEEGIAAPEAGNSAVQGANLIPLVTLGIPGNLVAALLLGAFMIHGLTPGPFLMRDQGHLLYALFLTLIVSNIVILFVGHFYIKLATRVQTLPREVIFPLIVMFCSIGAYAVGTNMFDVTMMFLFGVFGYFLRLMKISVIPVVIAFFLGPLLETAVRRSLLLGGGDLTVFLQQPISLAFLILTALALLFLGYQSIRRQRKSRSPATMEP